MKVYVVIEDVFGVDFIRGVFSTEEKAKKRIERRKKVSPYADIDYDEYTIDEELGP